MFGHLDLDGDSVLSVQELYDLEHDRSERCIRPFLERCSGDGGNVNPSEWCRCFERADRPCAAVKRRAVAEMLGMISKSTLLYFKKKITTNSIQVFN